MRLPRLFMPSMGAATLTLIIANVLVFLGQQWMPGDWWLINFALWPVGVTEPGVPPFEIWQIISYGFLHAGWEHIAFNMWAVYMFGSQVELVLGTWRYLALYFFSMVTAALTQMAVTYFGGLPPFPTIGASGAVFGILLAYGMFFPERRIMLIIPPIPMPARVFVVLYAAIELFLGVTGTQEGVAHFAHLGGLIGAFILLQFWRSRRPPQ